MTGLIAVHCGAGTHSNVHYGKYNRLSKRACRKAVAVLQNGGTALEAVKMAISILEDDPLTNCGYGSNLTIEGDVEGDASVMDGKTLMYGGCGAVKNLKNPINLAYDLCVKQSQPLPHGLIPPSFLVGKGAYQQAKAFGLKTVKKKLLVSTKARSQYKKYKKLVEPNQTGELLDTVGAVCVDNSGHVAAGCSSGGILLKRPGRVGQAAIYACGAWADSCDKDESAVAVCTSGCGEYIIRTQLAKEVAEDVKKSSCPTMGVSESITKKFLNSRFLKDVPTKLCGALVLNVDPNTSDTTLLWAHTTETMSVGFMRTSDHRPTALISELPPDVPIGVKVNVGGVYKHNDTT